MIIARERERDSLTHQETLDLRYIGSSLQRERLIAEERYKGFRFLFFSRKVKKPKEKQ